MISSAQRVACFEASPSYPPGHALRTSEGVRDQAADRTELRKRVYRILKSRRTRASFFDGDLFADPAWDILLDLYASDLAYRRTSVSAASIAANVPPTTALRWIRVLEKRGLVHRRDDPMDGRRAFVTLTETATRAMDEFFNSAPQAEQIL